MDNGKHDQLRLLIAHDKPELYLDQFLQRFPGLDPTICKSGKELEASIASAKPNVVLAYKCDTIRGEDFASIMACSSVQWLQNGGAGVEHLSPWDPEKLVVTNVSGVLSGFLAEYIVGAILMMNTGFPGYIQQMKTRTWQIQPWTGLAGKTLLVVGLGSIGKEVAQRARNLGMKVIGVSRTGTESPHAGQCLRFDQLDKVLPEADFITLHTPLTEQTRGLIDADSFALMKHSAVLINAARGPVVDEAALVAALKSKRIKGAVLDVCNEEPLPQDHPLWQFNNVVITPHMADSVSDWPTYMADFFADNLQRWLDGEPLLNAVDPVRGY